MIHVSGDIYIDEGEIKEEFIRAGGPGGQHVNKVSTAVQLRFDIAGSALPGDVKKRLKRLGGRRVTGDGVLVITARASRKREQNREAATVRLVALIKKACEKPKRRKKTRPTRASKERRIGAKKERKTTKRMRKKVSRDEE